MDTIKFARRISYLSQAVKDLIAEGGRTLVSDDAAVKPETGHADKNAQHAGPDPDEFIRARPGHADKSQQASLLRPGQAVHARAHRRPGRRSL